MGAAAYAMLSVRVRAARDGSVFGGGVPLGFALTLRLYIGGGNASLAVKTRGVSCVVLQDSVLLVGWRAPSLHN